MCPLLDAIDPPQSLTGPVQRSQAAIRSQIPTVTPVLSHRLSLLVRKLWAFSLLSFCQSYTNAPSQHHPNRALIEVVVIVTLVIKPCCSHFASFISYFFYIVY